MGEELKQEEPKKEEKKIEEENKEELKNNNNNNNEESAAEAEAPPPPPPPPFVLLMELHCVGCAKKIEKSILKIRGVEGVVTDMATNEVTIKGVVEPHAVCTTILNKTKKMPKVVSPLMPASQGQSIPEVVASQVSGLITIELDVNMHCEACALQLNKKILKMKGVRTVETDLSSSKVRVTGTMDADRLVRYVYRRTKKHARVVPQPEPEPAPEPNPNPVEESGDKKEESGDKKEESGGNDDQAPPPPPEEEEKKDPEEAVDGGVEAEAEAAAEKQHMHMQRMMYHYDHPPVYVMERIPAPQLFSDENPNACVLM
ncbi:heavy metal-associated isoprenylated plant protein 9 [Andrographis paniculata]|uniref:heavy metal-associated isoprenylated plant protein 9 n=1 Tax=Andrographis paniculata TaxID=175694 RepID=UPI0021E8F3CC|nr:heavy metal-associated isoprenylated plant protein 9 [Andrographis paniculata]